MRRLEISYDSLEMIRVITILDLQFEYLLIIMMDLRYLLHMQEMVRNRTRVIVSLPVQDQPYLVNNYVCLSPKLQQIYHHLFNQKQNEIKLFELVGLPLKKTQIPVCNKLFSKGEKIIRCYDCGIHQSSVYCMECFENGTHKGHRYDRILSGGGNCDCGNPMALKPQGFCVKHKGQCQIMELSENEIAKFIEILNPIWNWAILLHSNSKKDEASKLSKIIINLLLKLNDQSLYYNSLTFHLFFGKDNVDLMNWLFKIGIQNDWLANDVVDLYYKMFSLSEFKFRLSQEYLRAYNSIVGFQNSKYEVIYIQLFASVQINERLLKLTENNKEGIKQIFKVLDPSKKMTYQANIYYMNLIFIVTIKQQTARKMFMQIMKNKPIDSMQMRELQQRAEILKQKDANVIIFRQNLNSQNNYYNLFKQLIKLFRDDPSNFNRIIKQYYDQLSGSNWTYTHNKSVLIFHRVFALLVFGKFNCQLSEINVKELCDICEVGEEDLIKTLSKAAKQVISCLSDYAHCLWEFTYFSSYTPLYTKSGNVIVMYDLLFVKICAMLSNQKCNFLGNTLTEFLKEGHNVSNEKLQLLPKLNEKINKNMNRYFNGDFNENNSDLSDEDQEFHEQHLKIHLNIKGEQINIDNTKKRVQFVQTWTNMLLVLVDIVYSMRSEMVVGRQLKCETEKFKSQNLQYLKSIFLTFKQLTQQDLASLKRQLFGAEIQNEYLIQCSNFDKTKKKFVVKQEITGFPIRFDLIQTISKQTDLQLVQEFKYDAKDNIKLNKTEQFLKLREIVFAKEFINEAIQSIYSELGKIQNKKGELCLIEFVKALKKVNGILEGQNEEIAHFALRIQKQLKNQSLKKQISQMLHVGVKNKNVNNFSQEQETLRQNELKRKKEEKLKKMNFKSKQEQYLKNVQKTEEINSQNTQKCIICHSEDQSKILCYLSSFKLSNLFNSIISTKGKTSVFQSCFHPIHNDCFLNVSDGKEYFNCPLCKHISNCILPAETFHEQDGIFQNIIERLEIIQALVTIPKGKHFEEEQKSYSILTYSILFFIEYFGIAILQKQKLSQKKVKIGKVVLNFVKTVYNSSANKELINNQILSICQDQKRSWYVNINAHSYYELILFSLMKYLNTNTIDINQAPKYYSTLNIEDVNLAYQLMFQIANLDFKQISIDENQHKTEIKRLSESIVMFDPPKTPRQLLIMRDKQNMCKTGHQICKCLICGWIGCRDCKLVNKHTDQQHLSQGLYFSNSSGGFLFLWRGRKIQIPSNYLNQTGKRWAPELGLDGFTFDFDFYEKLLEEMRNNNLLFYILYHPNLNASLAMN